MYGVVNMSGERMTEATRERWKAKRKRDGGKFLSGPVPLQWLKQAAQLPGKSLAVGMAIWFIRGISHADVIKFTPSTWEQFGLQRRSVYNGLKQLESAGLVTVARHSGRCPVVTLQSVRKSKRP